MKRDRLSPRNVLVLCARNASRSQMAEAMLRRAAGDRLHVYSAGLEPAEHIHPLALAVMAEIGESLEGQRTKGLAELPGNVRFRYVIFACPESECGCARIVPGARRYLNWAMADPSACTGSEQERLAAFQKVREELRIRIERWLKELGKRRPAGPLRRRAVIDQDDY